MKKLKNLAYIIPLSLALFFGCNEKEKDYYLEKDVQKYSGYDIAADRKTLVIGSLHNNIEENLVFDHHLIVGFDGDTIITDMELRSDNLEQKIKLENFIDSKKLKMIYKEMINKYDEYLVNRFKQRLSKK